MEEQEKGRERKGGGREGEEMRGEGETRGEQRVREAVRREKERQQRHLSCVLEGVKWNHSIIMVGSCHEDGRVLDVCKKEEAK